jgi:hypothetical protein
LIDRGPNGGVAGTDARVIEHHPHGCVDARACGVDNHEIRSMPIVTAGAVAHTQKGDEIMIMHHITQSPNTRKIHTLVSIDGKLQKRRQR